MLITVETMDGPRPLPNPQLERTLRYGNPTRQELLCAASILAAYEQMVADPAKKRERAIAALRHAIVVNEEQQPCQDAT